MTGTPTRPLADLRISPIGLGGNVFGWTADEATSFDVLDAYVDAGGNLVDTADGYSYWAPGNSGGESETVIGSWLASRPVRDRIVLATKVSTKPDRSGLSADNIGLALEESLSRLRTDVVDIYYAHFDDESVPLEETVAAFEEARRAGKIRHVGLSNYTPERIRQWFAIADSQGSARRMLSALRPGRSGLVETFVASTTRSRTGREVSQAPITVSDSPPEFPGAQ